MSRLFVTTSIPYVNALPHLGHALELVQADVLARHARARGLQVRFQTGTDDNALSNVQAAEREGIPTRELVNRNAQAFLALRDVLDLSVDDVVRTSSDPRHHAGVHRLWEACAASGDLYRRHYEGLYCVGCEAFLDGNRCPSHDAAPVPVSEENWFFRLSRYQGHLEDLVASGRLRILPETRRNEVLGFVRSGLRDFSVSRSVRRARGWGIGVPGDPSQVIYVWWDALGNYITGPGYGTDPDGYDAWWRESAHRVHVIGKDILRFHAVYWPAILLSAGEAVPTRVLVHGFLTSGGRKLSKSAGGATGPGELVGRYGIDALRWWLLRDVPAGTDADFTEQRLIDRHDEDLAGGIGNLVARTRALLRRTEDLPPAQPLHHDLPDEIDAALEAFDFRAACGAILGTVHEANRYLERHRPWELDASSDTRGRVVGRLIATCRLIVGELEPLLPGASRRVKALLDGRERGQPFPRISPAPRPARRSSSRPSPGP